MYEKLLRLAFILAIGLLTSSSVLVVLPTNFISAAETDALQTAAWPAGPSLQTAFENGNNEGQHAMQAEVKAITAVPPGPITSTLLIANPVSETASVTLKIHDSLGAQVHDSNLSVPGAGLVSFSLPASLGSEFQGSAFLSADKPIQALVLNSNASNSARDLYDGSQTPSTSLTFPIFRHLGTDAQKSIIAVQNANPSDSASVTFHYYKPDGTEAAGSPLAPVTVLPLASAYFDSFQLFGTTAATYTVRIDSTKNIAGAEQVLFGGDTAALRGWTAADQPSEDESPQFYVDWVERKVARRTVTNWSEIYIRNEGTADAQVKVTYYLSRGTIKATETRTVPPNGLGIFSTEGNSKLGTGFAGYALVTETGNQPLAVQWLEVNASGIALYGLQGAASTQAASRWACEDARRFTANPTQKTKFRILNTDTAKASLILTLYSAADGSVKTTKTLSVKAKAQLAIDLSSRAYQKLGNAYLGLATLESTNGKRLVVAAYSSYGNLASTGSLCSPLPAVSMNAYLPLVVRDWTGPVAPPVQNPHLAILKQATETSYGQVGDVIHYTISATNDGNAALSAVTVTDPKAGDLACSPANGSSLDPGQSLSCTASHTIVLADLNAGSFHNEACVDDGAGGAAEQCSDVSTPSSLPPDPGTVAPPLDPSIVTSVISDTEFLYTGSNPIQIGVAPGTIQLERAAVLRGKVLTRDNLPLPGVTITVLGHPEFGHTLSRADGNFDLAVNGGGALMLQYVKEGLLTVQRQVEVPWQDYAFVPDVVMIAVDPQVTEIDLTASTPIQVARGSQVSDNEGSRQATVLVPQGTTATMTLPNGTTEALTTLHMRATEFTVGSNGPETMPAELPPSSGYTYAVEMTADEAVAAGATEITFNQPMPFYVEDFIGFPVGGIVPTGYYDRTAGKWIAAPNGRVIKVLSMTGSLADLDVDGTGVPADSGKLAALGITDAERQKLAQLYQPGQSLWRVLMTHFTPWDHNWPYGPPDDATPPDEESPIEEQVDDPCGSGGSIIGCETQTLGEDLPVTGTPFSLHYESDRSPGRQEARTLNISLTGAKIPLSLKRIELEIGVAGEIFRKQFQPQTNLDYTYVWDGKDAYGRPVQGERVATIKLIYIYPAVYKEPAQFASSFGGLSGGKKISGVDRSAFEIRSEQVWQGPLGTLQAQPVGLGGWDLSVHNTYDPASRTLYLGEGGKRSQAANAPSIVTIAGGGVPPSGIGDGGPATLARLYYPTDIALAPDGSYYVADFYHLRVRRVGSDGIITTVAGDGQDCPTLTSPCGNGGPATQAQVDHPEWIALGPDGSLYIAEGNGHRVRRVGPDGIITAFAGTGVQCSSPTSPCGDGGPADQAQFKYVQGIVVSPDGSVYISDMGDMRIRRVGPDGIITTVAGTGEICQLYAPLCGDGGPAAQAKLSQPRGLAMGLDGSLYITDTALRRIRRVGPDGIITTVAGKGTACATLTGACGDGGPALQAELRQPRGVSVGRNGSIYIMDSELNRVRRVDPDGSILGVAGSGIRCDAPFAPCGDGGPATLAGFNSPHMIAVGPDDTLYVTDTSNSRIRQVKPFLQGFSTADSLIASENGTEAYLFDHLARHVRTLNTLTGATLYQFDYDAGGRLASVTDGDANTTTIEHDTNGKPTAIVSPYGQRTALTVDENGYLKSITNPANETIQLAADEGGLLKTLTDARGGLHQFTYDTEGRLTKDEDPAGGSKTLERSEASDGYSVSVTTALSRTTTYQVQWLPTGGHRRVIVEPSGAQTEIVQGTNGQRVTILPDGTMLNLQEGPDPRFGMQAPLPQGAILTTPAGVTTRIALTRTVTLSDYPNPFSLTKQTDKLAINGRIRTTEYVSATNTFSTTTPEGRQQTSTIDAQGRVVQYAAAGLAPFNFTYDDHGRIIEIGQTGDGRAWSLSFSYNGDGYIEAVTDPMTRTTTYAYDPAGRLKQATLPGGRTFGYAYDLSGNVKGITPPGDPAHSFTYTPVDLLESYAPPDIGANGGPTGYEHNIDRQLKKVTLPTGQTIDLGYNTTGQLETVTLARGQVTYGYSPESGSLSSIAAPGGMGLTFSYDGSLHTGETWSGPVAGSVSRSFDGDLRTTGVAVNGTAVAMQYDDDNLPTGVGDLTLNRDAATGFLSGSSLGTVTDNWSYNTFGETQSHSASAGGTNVYAVEYTRDELGRITTKVETIGGATTTYGYDYDPAGRLKEVKREGVVVASYGYDLNGNRLNATVEGETASGTYDTQDRLTQYGSTTYSYTKDGRLQSKTAGGQTSGYQYDELGNLTAVTLPGGQQIDYLIDGLNRRVGKKVGGVLVQGFLYDGFLRPIAELDGSGNVVSRFVYAEGSSVPGYLIKGGVNYRIITDQVGSPRLVVNAATGAIAQRLDYDAFGNITQDTAPGFQPFGFAGGLYDRDTGLVRFGARDYDAETGRWTTKDPIGFNGGDSNLYLYSRGDPINLTDPTGLDCGGFLEWLKTLLGIGGDMAMAKYDLTPPVISDLKPLASEEGANDARSFIDQTMREKKAREVYDRTGSVEEYLRVRNMPVADFIREFAPEQSAGNP